MPTEKEKFDNNTTWREPVQARGKKRVAAILDAARELVVELGSTDLKMTELARRAEIPVGSLYQFFPTRASLLSRLFEIEMGPIDDALRKGLKHANSVDEIVRGVESLMKLTLKLVRQRPCLFVIWSSPETNPVIRQADFDNTKRNSAALSKRISELASESINPKKVHATSMLICHLWGAVVRLCITADEEDYSDAILPEYVEMIQRHLRNL